MKELRIAKNAGFCFGVKRAVDSVEREAASGTKLVTFGELIHNEQVVDKLSAIGVVPVDNVDNIPRIPGSAVVIRSHGVPPDILRSIQATGVRVIDLTCPFVKRIHRKVMEWPGPVYIIGAPDHPEVIGISGWTASEHYVVPDEAAAREVPARSSALVVAQTTITSELWQSTVQILEKRCPSLVQFRSICDTTRRRQDEACRLASECDAVIVIGGENSSNTSKLYSLCSERCDVTFRVSHAAQIPLENLKAYDIIGVIAGASTPDWLIREVQARMSEMENVQETVVVNEEETDSTSPAEAVAVAAEEVTPDEGVVESVAVSETAPAESDDDEDSQSSDDEADFMAAIDKSFVSIKRGQIVTGTVVQVSDNEICVNIGYKSDGILRKENLSAGGDINPLDAFKEGDEIEAEIVTLNDGEGNVLLSRRSIESKLRWKELLDSLEEDQVYTVKVDKVVKGGVLAKLEGYDAFIPASHLSLKYVEDLSQFVGQDLEVEIIEADKRQRRFVLSHKKVLEKKRAVEEQQLYESFHKGDKVQGKVKRLTDFGAFVDIGGVDGLLHVTDIAWTKVKHPSDVLNVGDDIEVLILNVDPERKRISLGLKQLQPKPWDLVPEKYIVGETVEGTVVRIMPFGAFVSLEPTIDGLIHISQVTNRRLEKVEEVLHIGDKVTAKIMEVNPAKKRISLSLRALMDEPSRPPRGDRGGHRGDRRGDYGDSGGSYSYKLPPVESVTVSVADAFRGAEEAKED